MTGPPLAAIQAEAGVAPLTRSDAPTPLVHWHQQLPGPSRPPRRQASPPAAHAHIDPGHLSPPRSSGHAKHREQYDHSFTIDTTVDINAGKDAVWDVLTDFASYKEWNPVMRIEGAPEAGTKLVVHLTGAGDTGMSFKPKVLAATPGKELRWLGKLGFHGIADGEHFFILTFNDDGTTRLNHGERFSGALVALAKGSSANSGAAYEAFSRALKQRVEQLCQTR